MKIFIATDIRIMVKNGRILANEKHSTILRRYYNAFGSIVLCARFGVIDGGEKGVVDISDIVDSIVEIDSLRKMFLNMRNAKIADAMKSCDLAVGRCPSIAAYKAADVARKLKKPFFAESMGCAWDAYWNHSLAGKIIAPYMFLKMKQVVWNADYALYVTNEFLQHRYPCKNGGAAVSNVLIQKISEDALRARLEHIDKASLNKLTLATTAAVNVRHKGQEYVIRALPELVEKGIDVEYLLIGEGDPSYLASVARKYKVADRVKFLGRIPLSEVFQILDRADIYVQPSLQEGLPRSVIEAMSRGCPCVGARTAGIPELLEEEHVVRRKSSGDIVKAIAAFSAKPKEEWRRVARRNFQEAKKYASEVLDVRRNNYYAKVLVDLKTKQC